MQPKPQPNPRLEKLLLTCSSSFRSALLPIISQSFETFQLESTSYLQLPNIEQRECILCLKALTSSPERWLIVTNTVQKAKLLYNLCSQMGDTDKAEVFRVGGDISITKDRETAREKSILIGDIQRVVYLIEHQYLRVFMLKGVIIENANQLIKLGKLKRLQKLMLLLPKGIPKTIICEQEVSGEMKKEIEDS